MIDIHNHILYGVDDGSSSRDETIKMLRIAAEEGIKSIIATPHYIVGDNQYTKDELRERYREIYHLIEEEQLPIRLYLGNELFADALLPDMLDAGDCHTLNDSQYVLMEFALGTRENTVDHVIYNVTLKGYRPIIAHPERTFHLERDLDFLRDLITRGCYIQVNSGSISGFYGDNTKRFVHALLECKMVHFVASDAHTCRRRTPKLNQAYGIVRDKYGESYANRIFVENGNHVLCNSLITYVEPTHLKKKSLTKRLLYFWMNRKVCSYDQKETN